MARDTSQLTDRIYMGKISSELNRHRSTIVTWQKLGWLPEGLAFNRDAQGWRYWTPAQLEQARAWMNRPGRRRAPRSASNAA